MRVPPKRRVRGFVELTTSTVMALLFVVGAAAVVGYLGWYAYNQKQIADAQMDLATLQAAGVLLGGNFSVVFNKPVTVVKIGYGYYDRNTGQESIVQWINVGKSGQTFQWNLGNSNYNVTYVVVDLGRGVYKVYRWRYYQVNLTSDMGAGAPASSRLAPYEAYVRVSSNNAFVGWQIKSSIDSVNGTGSTGGVTLKISKPGEVINASVQNPPGYTCTISSTTTQAWPYHVYNFTVSCTPWATVRVFSDNAYVGWQVKSSVDSVSGTGSATRTLKFSNGETISASITSNPYGWLCSISPTTLQPAPGGSYDFRIGCTPWATVRVFSDNAYVGWQVKSSVDSVSGTGSATRTLSFKNGESITASITSIPAGYLCSISPTTLQPAPGGSYDFRISCVKPTIYLSADSSKPGCTYTVNVEPNVKFSLEIYDENGRLIYSTSSTPPVTFSVPKVGTYRLHVYNPSLLDNWYTLYAGVEVTGTKTAVFYTNENTEDLRSTASLKVFDVTNYWKRGYTSVTVYVSPARDDFTLLAPSDAFADFLLAWEDCLACDWPYYRGIVYVDQVWRLTFTSSGPVFTRIYSHGGYWHEVYANGILIYTWNKYGPKNDRYTGSDPTITVKFVSTDSRMNAEATFTKVCRWS